MIVTDADLAQQADEVAQALRIRDSAQKDAATFNHALAIAEDALAAETRVYLKMKAEHNAPGRGARQDDET